MAQIPAYQPNVSERPTLQSNITVRASPEDMGAGIGRGLQQLGQGAQQASNAMAELRALEDQMRAKEADNAFAAWNREAQYGEGGYMTLQGQAAIEARDGYERTLVEKRREFGAGLTGGAAQMYGQASQARVNSTLDSSIVHAANERKTWFNDAANARLDTFAEDALAAWNNPGKVATNIAAGQAELRQQGAMLGWDADTLKNREAQYISDVRKNVALRHMSDDPIAAKAYIDANRSQLTGQAQFELDEALEVPLANAEGLKHAQEFMGASTREYPAAAVENGGQGPTNARAFLMDRLVTKGRNEDIDGLDGSFTNNLAALMQDAPFDGLGVLSGARSVERQQVLWDEALRKYGSPEAARKWVAPPGRSQHQHGRAVDVSYNGRSLKHAPKEVVDWVHSNAGKYGLTFPLANENWHIEPIGARGGGTAVANTGRTSPRASAPSWSSMEQYLQGIPDPRARDVARTAITAQMNASAKDAEAQRKVVAEKAFSEMVTQNVSPFSFAPEVQAALGMETMSSLMNYWEKQASGEKIETNGELLYQMQTAYATDPKAFGEVDLLQYRGQLSDEDWKTVTGWRQTALTDQRKASEEGLTLSSAFSGAQTALEAAGITTVGKDGDDRTAAAKQIAQFQNVLTQQIAQFRAENERAPNDIEIQSITNRLLLPVVIKPTNVDDGLFGNHFFGVGLPQPKEGFLFEAPQRPDGSIVEVAVKYEDIPYDLRETVRSSLETELGRAPTEEEIVSEYETFFLGLDK
jgi:LAS superfamily LD-carboxypeptidase LdcB